ncbi:patatin-like phospholipase family protein [Legionella hackeliae]|uniref:Patatin family protein n=1 Tax=Legionella hackeliae TaxID=449 RepID=A0A0A8UTH8_LEGHA|nr:patatin-like phospholipase family protein [Legionella hackeliae]KTD10561.1 alpha-beta hydrolase family transporter esterase [Legionella hackeliae]CEK10064.1 Patatin family protein [Legionella hackeliae]STX46790.1 patatin family protein [Legionella hackeliae]
MTKIALYLAGGGARGAYQAGALKAISTLLNSKRIPFNMLTGASVGSINTAVLAEDALDFYAATNKLSELWGEITCPQIFKTSYFAAYKTCMRNMWSMVFKQRLLGHILDTLPLRGFLSSNINFKNVEAAITNKHLETIEIISNCYETKKTISFYQHHTEDFEDWNYPLHISQRVNLEMEYFLASTALPLFFPPSKIDGFHYGDGHLGLEAPLRGAIHCQANKILVIGNRQLKGSDPEKLRDGDIDFSRVLGGMINGLFLDNLDRDIEMINHMNHIARLLPLEQKQHSPWQGVEILHLRPSVDIATLAQSHYHNIPMFLRLLLNFMGAKRHSGDLLSFLLFEKEFTRELIKLGYDDTMAIRDSILKFFDC